jgi:hypothetical protein
VEDTATETAAGLFDVVPSEACAAVSVWSGGCDDSANAVALVVVVLCCADNAHGGAKAVTPAFPARKRERKHWHRRPFIPVNTAAAVEASDGRVQGGSPCLSCFVPSNRRGCVDLMALVSLRNEISKGGIPSHDESRTEG